MMMQNSRLINHCQHGTYSSPMTDSPATKVLACPHHCNYDIKSSHLQLITHVQITLASPSPDLEALQKPHAPVSSYSDLRAMQKPGTLAGTCLTAVTSTNDPSNTNVIQPSQITAVMNTTVASGAVRSSR